MNISVIQINGEEVITVSEINNGNKDDTLEDMACKILEMLDRKDEFEQTKIYKYYEKTRKHNSSLL